MTFTVVKIGGCNGSGKTTLMRAVMALALDGPLGGLGMSAVPGVRVGKPEAYRGMVSDGKRMAPGFVLGSYETVCGGMDTISDKHERFALVERYAARKGIVFFEGLITGKTYGALGGLSDSRRHRGRWIYAFMDTPFEECVRRVLERREAKGNVKPFDPERTMRPTFRGIESVARRAKEAGHTVVMVNHKAKPATAAKALIARALENYHAR